MNWQLSERKPEYPEILQWELEIVYASFFSCCQNYMKRTEANEAHIRTLETEARGKENYMQKLQFDVDTKHRSVVLYSLSFVTHLTLLQRAREDDGRNRETKHRRQTYP